MTAYSSYKSQPSSRRMYVLKDSTPINTAASSFCFRGSSAIFYQFLLKHFLINTDNCHSQFSINKNINFGLRISPKERVFLGGNYVSGYEINVL